MEQSAKERAYKILAKDRYANRPEDIPVRVWNGVRSYMERCYMKELMNTPAGLYTNNEIWEQTFRSYLK